MDKDIILKWLADAGSGRGAGDASGYGYGDDGDGSGFGGDACISCSGFGYGSGEGIGDDFGCGSGYGYRRDSGLDNGTGFGKGRGYHMGYKLKTIKGEDIYYIDGVPTIIKQIINNYAKGFMVGDDDFSFNTCYIAKGNGKFAHGKTLREAYDSLMLKIKHSMTDEERIEEFCKAFEHGKKYKGSEFFKWHATLTRSCLMGRQQFVKDKGLSLENEFTVEEFITLTENSYGGDIIKQLKSVWNN